MRGKRSGKVFQQSDAGITPAGAGKTGFLVVCTKQAEDHPRRCGENYGGGNGDGAIFGSPPQVRGKLSFIVDGSTWRRITPAGAGKTHTEKNADTDGQDHPRRCGENARE